MEYSEIVSLMQEMTKMGLTRIKLEQDNFKLELEKINNISNSSYVAPAISAEQTAYVSAPVQAPASLQGAENIKTKDIVSDDTTNKEMPGLKKILSPMVGTFYAQPAPDKPVFVSVGDIVKKGQSVCIIEAMKLMNEIESEVEGEIIECLVENEDMVEFGQPLFLVK
ncbi:MAG: acetyl-CoA carboxylase biotin carboxyl carrier protein [Anaerolineaceae bacterium]|nr:MAG: acetyl-CoA carboxylase biotin carboxyl carrier protein [Anaerolineaceae bacterium]